MTIYEVIAKLNVLSSSDTTPAKHQEYKECINAILDLKETHDQIIKECIKLLSIDGVNTKAKVKDKLKGLLKWNT